MIVTEVGMIRLVPTIVAHLEKEGQRLRLKAVPLDSRQIEVRLEAGEADLAIGAFPDAAANLRRQPLYTDTFVSVVRSGHPRLGKLTQANAFLRERHVIVTSSHAGHAAHQVVERELSSRLEPDRVHVRVPSFVASAFTASRTDTVCTLPAQLAEFLAKDLHLAIFSPPLALSRIEIGQFWHERAHSDQGHRWFRAAVHKLLGTPKMKSGQRSR